MVQVADPSAPGTVGQHVDKFAALDLSIQQGAEHLVVACDADAAQSAVTNRLQALDDEVEVTLMHQKV